MPVQSSAGRRADSCASRGRASEGQLSSAHKGPVLTGCAGRPACGTAPWRGPEEHGMTFSSERQAGGTGCHPAVSKQGRDPASGDDVLPRMADTLFIASFN